MVQRMDELEARAFREQLEARTRSKLRREVFSMAAVATASVTLMVAVEAAVIMSGPL